jgi:hypothetical protein
LHLYGALAEIERLGCALFMTGRLCRNGRLLHDRSVRILRRLWPVAVFRQRLPDILKNTPRRLLDLLP